MDENNKYKDITETGPLTGREIKEDNESEFKNLKDPSFNTKMDFRNLLPPRPYSDYSDFIYEGPEYSPIILQGNGDYYGKSRYDKGSLTEDDWRKLSENPNELRARQQSAFNKYAHGITKGVALAGTTFLDGTLGLLYGVPSMIAKWADGGTFMDGVSQIWANDLSNALQNINDKMEEWLPNYRTQSEQEKKWWQNVGTANFWADGFLKNLGFTVGAFYSGNAWLKGLKALNLVKSAASAQVVGSLLSGFNEGRIEANNAQREFIDAQTQYLSTEREKLAKEIESNPDLTNYEKEKRLRELDANLELQRENMMQNSNGMGLTTLIANTIILTADNMLQFGKLYSRGFDTTRGMMNRIGSGMQRRGIKGSIKNGGKLVGEEITRAGAAWRGARNALSEGFEEMNQATVSNFAGYWFGGDSSDSYHLALEDPSAKVQSRDFFSALGKGIVDTYGDGDRWEEFAIGFLTGAIGMTTFGSANNSDANTWLKLGKFGISGGMIGEYRSALEESRQNVEDAEKMNKYLDKIRENANYFVQSQSFTNAMQGFAMKDNKFEYENMSDNDDYAAAVRFAKRGRLEDLKEIINQDFENMSDEQLKQIAMNLSPRVTVMSDGTVDYEDRDGETSKGGWKNVDGTLMSDTPEGLQEMREKLIAKRDKILKGIDNYMEAISAVRSLSMGVLSDEQTNELAWYYWKTKALQDRFGKVTKPRQNALLDISNKIDKYVEKHTPTEIPVQEEGESDEHYNKRKKNAKAKIRREKNKPQIDPVILNDLAVVSELFKNLSMSDSSLEFSALAEGNKHIFELLESDEGLGKLLNAVISKEAGLNAAEYKEFIRDISDAGKIAIATMSFNQKFKEFMEDPSKLFKHKDNVIKKAKDKISNIINKKEQKAAEDITDRFDFEEPPQLIAMTIKNNIGDINKLGGIEKWKQTLTKEQQDAVNKALRFVKVQDSINGIIDDPKNEKSKGEKTKQYMKEFMAKAADDAANMPGDNDAEKIIESAKKLLNTNWLDDFVAMKSPNFKEEKQIEYIAKLKTNLKSILEENEEELKRAAKAAENLDRIYQKEQNIVNGAPNDRPGEGAENTDENGLVETHNIKGEETLVQSKDKTLEEPKKGSNALIEPKDEDIVETTNIEDAKNENLNRYYRIGKNKKQEQYKRGKASTKRYNKTNFTEYLFGGIDLEEYGSHIGKHEEDIPELTGGYTKDQYKRYVDVVHKELKEKGAFKYVNDLLSSGQDIEFYFDEELSQKAGTPIVLMRIAGTDQIIGSMPSEIDFNAKPSGMDKTLKEIEPNKYKLYREIVDKKAVHKTKIKEIYGGDAAISSETNTLSEIFSGTNEKPILALTDSYGNIATGNKKIDNNILQGDFKKTGTLYVLIPSKSGKYLPVSVSSLSLKEVLEKYGENDWYINKIIEQIQKAPVEINDENKNYQRDLYKWLRLTGLNTKAVYSQHGTWTDDKSVNLVNATHIQIDYDDDNGKHKTIQIKIDNGEINREEALKELKTIIDNSRHTTTNLNLREMKSENAEDYFNNIQRYLVTNLVKGQTHSINNWFTYEGEDPTEKSYTSILRDDTSNSIDPFSSGGENDGSIKNQKSNPVNKIEQASNSNAGEQKENDNSHIDNANLKSQNSKKNFGAGTINKNKNKNNNGLPLLVSRAPKEQAATEVQLYRDVERIKKMFPSLSDAERIVLVDGLIKTVDEKGNPVEAYGYFMDGVLYISSKAPKGTTFHEAFHYITDALLNDSEKEQMFKDAEKRYNLNDKMELEERLAEDFRDYMNGMTDNSIKGFLKRIFERLKHIIQSIIGNRNKINNLFYDIYRDKYNRIAENPTINGIKKFMLKEQVDSDTLNQIKKEMESIREKAIADGRIKLKADGSFDYALAPNGKRSNLNETQWLLVRTKAFKEWFGDWEKYALKHNITFEIYPNDSLDDGVTENTGIEYDIIYNGNTIGSIYTDNESGKYIDISSLGSAVNIQQEYRGKHFGTDAYIKLALEAESIGKTLRSAELSEMSDDAKRLWNSLVSKGIARKENDRYYFNKIDVSKVVDENGEPLVVYHTTHPKNDPSFTIFDIYKEGKRSFIYTTDSFEMSKSYAPNESRNKSTGEVVKKWNKEKAEIQINKDNKSIQDLKEFIERYNKANNWKEYFNDESIDETDFEDFSKQRAWHIKESENSIKNLEAEIDFLYDLLTHPKKMRYTKALFVNIRNPFIVNAEGNWWNELNIHSGTEGVKQAKYMDSKKRYKEEVTHEYIIQHYGQNVFDAIFEYDSDDIDNHLTEEDYKKIEEVVNKKYPEDYTFNSTRTIESLIMEDNSYDGMIVKDVKDYGPGAIYVGDNGNVFAAKEPNQIKSATDNMGFFTTNNDNIYDNNILNSGKDTFKEDLLDYKYRKTDYSNLDQETKDYLKLRGISEEEYSNMAAEQREILLQCM